MVPKLILDIFLCTMYAWGLCPFLGMEIYSEKSLAPRNLSGINLGTTPRRHHHTVHMCAASQGDFPRSLRLKNLDMENRGELLPGICSNLGTVDLLHSSAPNDPRPSPQNGLVAQVRKRLPLVHIMNPRAKNLWRVQEALLSELKSMLVCWQVTSYC